MNEIKFSEFQKRLKIINKNEEYNECCFYMVYEFNEDGSLFRATIKDDFDSSGDQFFLHILCNCNKPCLSISIGDLDLTYDLLQFCIDVYNAFKVN